MQEIHWKQIDFHIVSRSHPRRAPLLFMSLLVAMFLAGCQREAALISGGLALLPNVGSSLNTTRAAEITEATTQVSTEQPTLDLETASNNRILVQGVDGNLFTITPGESERFYLTSNAGVRWLYSQPTWSTSGDRVAWTAVERTADGVRSALVTALADGTEQTVADVPFPPFYLYWSPDDSKVAYLSNWLNSSGQTIALRAVDITKDGENATTLDLGQPYYFSWAPNGEQLIAHVDNRQVRLLDASQRSEASDDEREEPEVLVDGSANFAAPQWYSDITVAESVGQLLYVLDDGNTAQLVISDVAGDNPEFLTYLTRQDMVSFSMNATGSHIAYIETTERVGFNSFGPLFLYNLEEEFFEQLSTEPAIAFFWSPDGSGLYFLTVELLFGRVWLRVNVWDGDDVRQYGRFLPSPDFLRDYLRFADQYMQSMRFWAPDSSAVLYTGQGESGAIGVWVQSLDGEAPPELVAPGTFATWSPR